MRKRYPLMIFVAAFLVAGCAPKTSIRAQVPSPTVAPTTGSGPQVPSLIDIHSPVSDQDYQQARAQINGEEPSRGNLKNFYTVAQYQFNHNNLAESLKTYQAMLRIQANLAQLDKAQYMVGQIYYEKKDYLPSLAAFQTVMDKYPKSAYAEQSQGMMEFILTYSLSLEDLKRYVANYPNSPLICPALFQLGSREAQAGLQADAISHLNPYTQQCPDDPSYSSAQLLLRSLQSQQQGKSWKIGLLAPMTGRFKSFGESIKNGVALAIQQANLEGGVKKPISLILKDTGDPALDPTRVIRAFQDLNKDNSLDAVIGPVLASDIQAVAPIANQQKITLLCPAASRDGLSVVGPYLFSNSMTNEMQGRAMARYAVDKLGCKRFGILAPNDGYGQTLAEAFEKTVDALGGTITASASYPATITTDFKKQLVLLGGQDPNSSKENDRENTRRLDELKYSLTKEIGKILVRARALAAAAPTTTEEEPGGQPIAFVPLVEGRTNTACPSVSKDVNDTLRGSFKDQAGFQLRTDDLVQQALTRLPVEFKGTTLAPTADQWNEIAQEAQVPLLVTGRVVETNLPNDWSSDDPTWDYNITIEAYRQNPKTEKFGRIYMNHVQYSFYKPSNMLRRKADYQALYLPAHASEIPLLVSQSHFYDLNPVFLGGHLWENDTVLREGAKDLEGSYFVTGFYVDSSKNEVKKFVDNYLKKYAKRPDLLAAQAYDAARLLLAALANSSDRDNVHNQLMQIRDFEGVSGKTTFGGHGEPEKVVPVIQIKDGKYNQVQ